MSEVVYTVPDTSKYSAVNDLCLLGLSAFNLEDSVSPERRAEQWDGLRSKAADQAVTLRKLADVLDDGHVPFKDLEFEFDFVPNRRLNSRSIDEARNIAKHCAAVVNEVLRMEFRDTSRDKLKSDFYWGITGDLGESISLTYRIPSERTCTLVPKVDDDGAPVMETVTQYQSVEVEVTTQATEKKCISLFGE